MDALPIASHEALIHVTLVGTMPLLMDRLSEEDIINGNFQGQRKKTRGRPKKQAEAATEESTATAQPRGPRPTAKEVCAPKVHMHEGEPIIPAENFLRCLIEAGKHVPHHGRTAITSRNGGSTFLPSFLAIEGVHLPLRAMEKQEDSSYPRLGGPAPWEPDIRRGGLRTRPHKILRPKFTNWGTKVTLRVNLQHTTLSTVRKLVKAAGYKVGLGSFRPEFQREDQRGTFFGQFKIYDWEVVTKD